MEQGFEKRKATYDRFPKTKIDGKAVLGYEKISKELMKTKPQTIVVDCYIGADVLEIGKGFISGLSPDNVFCSDDIFYDGDVLSEKMQAHLSDDRVRGVMYYGKLEDFIDEQKLLEFKEKLAKSKGLSLVYGVGASIITKGDCLVYADMARWEIQKRYRTGMPNFKQDNHDMDILKKYKRGYFIEWRIADKHKRKLLSQADFWLDVNKKDEPKMISADIFKNSLEIISKSPFRLVPYFDPGVWGGQWMKHVCNLPKEEENYAWSFDGVPEENSLLLDLNGTIFEMPANNAIFYKPKELLGQSVYDRFGTVFPIRFDFLDTFGGQKLSLQVHPDLDFCKEEYGMHYTQEESYYILDAKPGAKVYLGLKDGADKEKMFEELELAQKGEIIFNADKYANTYETKAHDHFLIPPGTLHCSAENVMVLEISAAAYIFTFKLWDWDRLGSDGLRRPIHLDEGKAVLNFDYNDTYARKNLINQFKTLEKTKGSHVERTGLHEREYLETIRYTMTEKTYHNTEDNVNMLNLVSGEEIIIESPSGSFAPLIIHYAETFILPAAAGEYTMRPYGQSEGKEVIVIKAYVKKQAII